MSSYTFALKTHAFTLIHTREQLSVSPCIALLILWKFYLFTSGFGSTANAVILTNGVHYDCGCVLTQNGDLMQFSGNAVINSLNVPAVYVAFFSTFGAFVSLFLN